MKYNGKELVEMTPENWDGKSRNMLVWDDVSKKPFEGIVVGYYPQDSYWMAIGPYSDGYSWQHCAEIPTEAQFNNLEEASKIINAENKYFKAENEQLKAEVKELKERIKTLTDEPENNGSYITNNMTEDEIIEKFKTLRSELMYWLAKNNARNLLVNNLQYGIKTALNLTHANHYFIDVVDFSKIDANAKKTRRMTHRELANWLSKGNGEWTNAGNRTVYQRFDYDVERENEAVSEHIKIRRWDETKWHAPLIEE